MGDLERNQTMPRHGPQTRVNPGLQVTFDGQNPL
jgi:hypothetical protein